MELLYNGEDNSTARHHMLPKKKIVPRIGCVLLNCWPKDFYRHHPPNITGQSYHLSSTT